MATSFKDDKHDLLGDHEEESDSCDASQNTKNTTAEQRVSHYEDCEGKLKIFREVLREHGISRSNIKVLITGRVGMGKSTLINSIIGENKEVAKEGYTERAVTNKVKTYSYRDPQHNNIFSLIDSPGLRHSFDRNNKQFYENLFEDMMIQGENTNIVFYCRKMTNQRFEEDELIAIRQLFQAFGPRFWERVVIVLTFANQETCDYVEEGDPPFEDEEAWKIIIRERFINLLELRKNELKNILKIQIPMPPDIVDRIRFVPAGYYKAARACPKPFRLPDRENWLKRLLTLCCDREEITLSSLNLRENLHLAVIIDDEGKPAEIVDDENESLIKLNPPADMLKKALKDQGQLVFAYNSLSTRLVTQLLQAITSTIKSSQLAAFSLIILSKENDFKNILASLENVFQPLVKVPKMFFTHIDSHSKFDVVHPTLPPKSIGFTVKSPSSAPVIDLFTQTVEDSFAKVMTDCFAEMKNTLEIKQSHTILYEETFDQNGSVFPPIYLPPTSKAKLDFSKKKLDIQCVIWRKIRSQTCEELFENKDEIRKLLRNERIARITTSLTGIIIGGGLVVGGIAAAPFTFGASIGLAVAGGAVGVVASAGGIGAMITRKVMANSCLKKAQEQVSLDQQLSTSINENVLEYYGAIDTHIAEISAVTGAGIASGLAVGGRLGMAAVIGAEGIIEGGAFAVRTTGRVAGMALAGASLAVTVPIDIAFIAYHSYRIHQVRGDDSGVKETDSFVRWFLQQIEGLFLDTITLHKHDYVVEANLKIANFGFQMQGKLPDHVYTVRTLFSGPFKLPHEATLVSAVYDVVISKGKLEDPLSITLDHCVDVKNDQSNVMKISFAIGKLNFADKCYDFELAKGGSFTDSLGTINVTESCQICIVYTGEEVDKPIKYAGLCSYDRSHQNHWNVTIMFIKHLDAHLQFVKREFPAHASDLEMYPFKVDSLYTGIPLEQFKQMSIQDKGWIIASTKDIPENQTEISRRKLNIIEIQSDICDSPVEKIPTINLCVQVNDEATAVDEFVQVLKVEGTNLELPIQRKKEIRQSSN